MISCPRCGMHTLEHLKYMFVTFCRNKGCDFQFKGTVQELEEHYE